MHIVFFSRLFVPHIGGVEKHVLEVGKILVTRGHKVSVVTEEFSIKDIPVYLQSGRRISRRENINSIEVYRIPVGRNDWFRKFRIWRQLWKHRQLIENADIIHCHDVFFWYLPFRFIHPFKKVFTTFHGYESYPLTQKAIFIRKISEILSFGNICIGDFIKKWYGTKPTYTSYGGVRISNFQFPISNKVKKESAVFIGRLDEQTGIKTYVNAVKLIRKEVSDFKFEIVGDGLFRKEIEKDFEVLGFKKNPEKYFLKYNFAFVSRYLSILEAMAARRLVFAVYDNLLKEDYLRMTPFSKFINIAGSEKELSDLVIDLIKDSKKEKEMIEKGFAWVKSQSWDNTANIYLRLWNK